MMMSKKLKLYLDDLRTPIDDDWIIVRNHNELINEILLHGLENFEIISLDHDLGDTAMSEYFNNVRHNFTINYDNIKENTGLDSAKWIVSHYMDKHLNSDKCEFPTIYTHSANPIGASNIMGYINNFLKNIKKPQTCIRVNIKHTMN